MQMNEYFLRIRICLKILIQNICFRYQFICMAL